MEKVKNKKSALIAIFCIFAILPMLVFATGCFVKDKTFDTGLGLKITLTSQFEENYDNNFDYVLVSNDVLFVVDKDTKYDIEDAGYTFATMSVPDYLQSVMNNNNASYQLQTRGDLSFYEYQASNNGYSFKYIAFAFKGQDCFYLCQFGCLRDDYAGLKENFFKWINTVEYVKGETIVKNDKQFSHMGMTIIIDNTFKEVTKEDGIYILAGNQDLAFVGMKFKFTDMQDVYADEMTAADFANAYIESGSLSADVSIEGEKAYFVYSQQTDAGQARYKALVLKGEDAFFLCQFGCLQSQYPQFEQVFTTWLESVTLDSTVI